MNLAEIEKNVASISNLQELEKVKADIIGKNGALTDAMKNLRNLNDNERKEAGAELNVLKNKAVELLNSKREAFEAAALNAQLQKEKIDVTLPVQEFQGGSLHPLNAVIDEVVGIFANLGFKVAEGPEIEDDFHNFTALNIPPEHPARQMQDTFFVKGEEGEEAKVLRTQTSDVQIRFMENNEPPYKIIAPGKTYRSDSDQTHSPMFHQIECLYVDKGVNFAQLKWTLEYFVSEFFEIPREKASEIIRLRPSYFPFTEPSAEVDVKCTKKANPLKIGEGDDWLEILGCGMVHPNVLKNVGVDPEIYTGFAFGVGVERLAMLKYGVPDLRAFFEGKSKWLEHYVF